MHIRRFAVLNTLALVVLLAGCAGMSYVMDTYSGVKVQKVASGGDEYRVFDRPDLGKVMITPSLGKAAIRGAAQGALLNSADFNAPYPVYLQAAKEWLKQTNRSKCKVVEGYLVLDPQYEFVYKC